MGSNICTIRLRGRIRQLGRRLVGGQEGLVLHQCWKRLRDAEWRLCLMRLSKIYLGMGGRWRMRAIFGCFWLLVLNSIVQFKLRRISWEFERWRSRHLPALVVKLVAIK